MINYFFAAALFSFLHVSEASVEFTITNNYVISGTTSTITCVASGMTKEPDTGGFKSISSPNSEVPGTYATGNDVRMVCFICHNVIQLTCAKLY